MGGDHKCPVCEATFTRPQHVARHMRSHTGDRPYKCQYCGDQFARSDLLSRHVNKCHANEKPLPTTGVRRKGSASASRATTSKQVCDQCVQANSSCDGCNPCAKCIQRKFRCTFVKFHRQTAPVGPGHNIRPDSSSSPPSPKPVTNPSSSSSPMYHHPEDGFILGPPPTVVPTMAEALYGATPFTFPPLYPANEMGPDNTDYVGKYRAHAELFGSRSGMTPNTAAGMTTTALYDHRPPSSWLGWGQQEVTDAYHHQQEHHATDLVSDSVHPPPSLSPHAASSSMNDKDMQVDLAHHHHQQQERSNTLHYMNLSIPYPLPLSPSNYHLSDPNNNNHNGSTTRRGGESIDYQGSDSASHSSCSVPSSATSSSAHLPLAVVDSNLARRGGKNILVGGGGYDNMNGALLIPDRAATSSTSSSSSSHLQHQNAFSEQGPFSAHDPNAFSSNQHQHPHHHHHHHQHQHQPHPHSHPHHHHLQQQQQMVSDNLGRPEFSSAFGLLSLDDPNVMAGISTDGTPFFDDPSQAHNQPRRTTSGSTTTTVHSDDVGDTADMDTPMPMKRGQLPILSHEDGLGGSSSGQRFPISVVGVENGSSPPHSRERDSRELKEFWKQYMRMPLSGSGILSSSGGGSEGMMTPSSGNGNKSANNVPGPGPGYRRPRVASLPTVKTPVMERDRDILDLGFANAMYQTQQQQDLLQPPSLTCIPSNATIGGETARLGGMGMSMSMGDNDNTEDLRSYEAAVMARKAPTTLNLKVRRPMRGRGRGGGGEAPTLASGEGSGSSASCGNSPHPPDTTGLSDGSSSSSSSSSSSLANAFGVGQRLLPISHSRDKTLVGVPLPRSSANAGRLPFTVGGNNGPNIKKEESSSPSLLSSPASSSLSADVEAEPELEGNPSADMGGGGIDVAAMPRPSFKRLPSQTLGPDHSKRPFYGFQGGDDTMEDRSVGGWGGGGDNGVNGGGGDGRKDVVVVGVAERRMRKRRMSEPSSTSVTIGGVGREEEQNQSQMSSRGDVSAVQTVDEAMM